MAVVEASRAVVLVEGESDRVAVTTLARLRGRDLRAEGVEVVPMGGATNVHRFLGRYVDAPHHVRLVGMCDAGERRHFARAVRRHPFTFFVCERDLEDELIRCLGAARVVDVVAAQGEAAALSTFRRQPAQRTRPVEAQLHRFLGTHSGRKAQYARALVEALPAGAAPAPLAGLLDHLRPPNRVAP